MVRGQGRATRQARVAHGLSRSRSCNRCCMGGPIERCASGSEIVSSIVLRHALMSSSVTPPGAPCPPILLCGDSVGTPRRASAADRPSIPQCAPATSFRPRPWQARGPHQRFNSRPMSSWRSTASAASEITLTLRQVRPHQALAYGARPPVGLADWACWPASDEGGGTGGGVIAVRWISYTCSRPSVAH
jgi:hypothetical protein